jgi:hypothetical protein
MELPFELRRKAKVYFLSIKRSGRVIERCRTIITK